RAALSSRRAPHGGGPGAREAGAQEPQLGAALHRPRTRARVQSVHRTADPQVDLRAHLRRDGRIHLPGRERLVELKTRASEAGARPLAVEMSELCSRTAPAFGAPAARTVGVQSAPASKRRYLIRRHERRYVVGSTAPS